MSNLETSPVVACVSPERSFYDRIGHAASSLGSRFIHSRDFKTTLDESARYSSSCVVVDYEGADRSSTWMSDRHVARDRFLLCAIPVGNVEAAFEAASFGAAGVFEKVVPDDQLEFLLKAAFASEKSVKEHVLRENRFSSAAFAELSVREKAILDHLVSGEPNKRVASLLDIGLRTVEADRAQIMRKLGVDSFAELVAYVTQVEADIICSRQKIFHAMALGKRIDFPL